jgi:carbon storage regulator
MLVLTRNRGEGIVIDGVIRIQVMQSKGSRVRIGIEAPDSMQILREELLPAGPPQNPVVPIDIRPQPVTAEPSAN